MPGAPPPSTVGVPVAKALTLKTSLAVPPTRASMKLNDVTSPAMLPWFAAVTFQLLAPFGPWSVSVPGPPWAVNVSAVDVGT